MAKLQLFQTMDNFYLQVNPSPNTKISCEFLKVNLWILLIVKGLVLHKSILQPHKLWKNPPNSYLNTDHMLGLERCGFSYHTMTSFSSSFLYFKTIVMHSTCRFKFYIEIELIYTIFFNITRLYQKFSITQIGP